MIPRVGFLPPDDSRVLGTIAAIQNELTEGGFVKRYETSTSDDGLPGGEGLFLACSFWLVDALHLAGQQTEATQLFERLLALRNDVGLLSEEWDPHTGRQLGNTPQAFSHFPLVTNWNVTLPRATAGTGAVTPPENTSRPARKPSGVVHNSRQCRPRPDRSRAAFSHSRSSHDSYPTTDPVARPPAADTIALPLVGRKPAHRQALLERHRPRVDQRQAPRAGLGIDVGDLELPARRRRRRVPADHTHPRHGKAVFRPVRPHVLKI